MPRYRFTAADLAPLRTLLALPLADEAVAAVVPIKRFAPPVHARDTIELPVSVLSRDNPDGVPLPELLAQLKAGAPSVRGLAVRGDTVQVTYDAPPSARERKAVDALLTDRDKLLSIKPRVRPRPTAAAPRPLEDVLLDAATPDAEWLPAFRRWAVEHLIEPG